MTLMLLGNAGVATVIASLVVGIIDQGDDGAGLLVRTPGGRRGRGQGAEDAGRKEGPQKG